MSALDNVEVWQEDAVTCQGCHTTFPYYTSEEPTCPNCGKKPVWVLGENGTGRWEYWFLVAGRAWWYWHCFSGCLPESEARGPYDTEQEALDAAHEDLGVCTHGIPDDYICDDCPTPEGTTR